MSWTWIDRFSTMLGGVSVSERQILMQTQELMRQLLTFRGEVATEFQALHSQIAALAAGSNVPQATLDQIKEIAVRLEQRRAAMVAAVTDNQPKTP